jgi:transcriptional activator SPT7
MYGSGINPLHRPASRQSNYVPQRLTAHLLGASRMRTPNLSDEVMSTGSGNNAAEAGDAMGEDDPRQLEFQERYRRTEARLLAVLGDGSGMIDLLNDTGATSDAHPPATAPGDRPPAPASTKKAARTIDEDDYGDDDDEDEDDHEDASPLKLKSAAAANNATPVESSRLKGLVFGNKPILERINTTSSDQVKSSDDIRKKLEQDKKAIEDAARRSFNTMFYTLETDRDAMLEQQKLDELDRQVENELSGQGQNARSDTGATQQPGILGTTNLGGSIGLTMKHLIAKIDQKRSMVKASDAQLRQLINDVRRGRSKWASDEKVGQEELYEGLEKVLMELKASEHAHPFLQKVNKREAPDYYTIIKQPMDIGTMMKKLKNLNYKSKKEFVDDLMLIWSNCLKYNSEPSHYLRKKALHMKKETERLVPLIPDIVVRDRAEVDAEERARNADLGDLDDSEDGTLLVIYIRMLV